MDSPLRGRTNSWRGSMHSLDRGTQTDEEDFKSASHSPEKKSGSGRPSPALKETEHVDDSDDQDDHPGDSDWPSDHEGHAQIETALPVMARARVVSVPKRVPPNLPPRNPHRVSSPSKEEDLADGFDRVSLNGSEHPIYDRQGGAVSQDAEDMTDLRHDEFHSSPATPLETKEGIPGSFD